ncbi:hypothetical protein D3C72_471060 [compost metagenome]
MAHRSSIVLVLALLATPCLVVVPGAPAAWAAPAAQTPSAKELKAAVDKYHAEVEAARKRHGVADIKRQYPLTGATGTLSTGEEWISFEVAFKRPVTKAAAQAVATGLFQAFGQKTAIDFKKPNDVTRTRVLYAFLYEAKTVQLGPLEKGEGAGCSIELALDAAGNVKAITYVSGS